MTRVALVTEGANEDAVPERPKSNPMRRWPAVPLETASQAQGVPDSQPLFDNQRTVLVPFQTLVSPGRRSSTCRRPPPLVSLNRPVNYYYYYIIPRKPVVSVSIIRGPLESVGTLLCSS